MKDLPVNQIVCGRAEDVLKEMPTSSVDLVFGSPPYEDARLYNMDFKLKGQAWVDWMVPIIKECVRVCKGLVAFVVEGRTRQFQWSATPVLLMADLHRAGITLRKPPAYHRIGIPGSGGPDWLRNDYEFIICCTNGGKLPWSDNTAMGQPCKYEPGGAMSYRTQDGYRRNKRTGVRLHRKRRCSGEMEEQAYNPPKKANPGNILTCKVGGGNMGSKLAHENEAPFAEQVVEFFIKSFCPPDGITLDPFSGSGTTLAVAEKFGRRWMGIDIRESQVELSKKRIKEQK